MFYQKDKLYQVVSSEPGGDPLANCSEITSAVGMDFFHLLNRYLANRLEADSVYIAEVPFHAKGCLQTLAAYRDGETVPDYSFVADGTPCYEALHEGLAACKGDLHKRYSGVSQLAAGLSSYLAIRLFGRYGQGIGVMALGWRSATPDLDKAQSVANMILNRASAELQRLRTAALLEEQLHFTQEILNAIPIPVFYKDTYFRYLGCNREFEKAIGRSKDELIGKTVKEVAPNDYFGRYMEIDRQVLESGEPKSYEGPMPNEDGELHDMVFKKAPLCDSKDQRFGIVGTMFDVTSLKKAEKAIYKLVNYDPTTGLPNRKFFMSSLEKSLAHNESSKRKMAVLCLDFDHYKALSSSLGPELSNQLLAIYSERLTRQARDRDTYARTGSDRFAILLSSIEKDQDAGLVARKILSVLTEPVLIGGQEIYITGSIGISLFPNDGETASELMQSAESAMLRARKQGGNNYVHSSQEFNRSILERLAIEAGLRRSLVEGSFELHYQPQVDLQTGALIGAEALLRWTHPKLGPVSPAKFIPIAEESGLIGPIGEWVLKTACAQNAAWQAAGFQPIPIAVNLSGYQLRHKNLVDRVASILKETGLEPRWLELELTESVMMENSEANVEILEALKGLGIQLSIDDFGTGYSSLSYLQRFPLDKLKIDRSFVKNLHKADGTAAITDAVIAMAHRLDLKVVAEGIEMTQQKEHLLESGCLHGQGYLFGFPVPSHEFQRHFQTSPQCEAG